jgi:hypothetical protein
MTSAVPASGTAESWRYGSFRIVASSFILLIASAGAPVPLFAVYQAKYEVTDAHLTGAFAVYVVSVSGALLLLGRASDTWGRRAVSATALFLGAVASLVMSQVGDVDGLYVGRTLQGLAIGIGTSALGAWAFELRPDAPGLASAVVSGAPTGGLACGALLGGGLLDLIATKEGLVMLLIAGALTVAGLLTLLVRETTTATSRTSASARPSFRLPAGTWGVFLAGTGIGVSAWAMGGFYQSLVPSVIFRDLGVAAHVVGGVAVAALVGTSSIAGLLLRHGNSMRLLVLGASLLASGTTGLAVALAADSLLGTIAATVPVGVGHGVMFLVAIRVVAQECEPRARAGVLAAFFLVCYLGSVAPMVTAGWGAGRFELTDVMTIFMLAAAATAAASAVLLAKAVR